MRQRLVMWHSLLKVDYAISSLEKGEEEEGEKEE